MSSIPTPAFLDPNIAEILRETARARPDYPAIVSREEEVSYAGLAARAAAVTAALLAARLRPEDRVAIFLERGADAAAAFFGTVAAGGVAIMVNESLRPRQIDHILQHCGFRNVLADLPRYPEITPEMLQEAAPRLILLSSEPYPFKEKHIAEFQALCPQALVKVVDGEMFSWYGNRLLHAPAYLQQIVREVSAASEN